MAFILTNRRSLIGKEAGALHTKLHRLGRDATFLISLIVLMSGQVWANQERAIALPEKWRDAIISKHLPHMTEYKECIALSAQRTQIPEMLILSILKQENGRVGKSSINKDKTKDHGPGQINDVRADELSKIGLTISDVRNDGCKNVIGVAFLLSKEFDEAKGDLWTAVGNYHYSKQGRYPRHHFRYIRDVHETWMRLYATLQEQQTKSVSSEFAMAVN